MVAPLGSITARAARDGLSVTYDNGSDIASAVAAAESAKTAVVFAYARRARAPTAPRSAWTATATRSSRPWPPRTRTPSWVLETGPAVAMPWLSQVKGVVEAWYPGEQQGPALAGLLFGDVNFTGKLPLTFPKSLADTPTSTPAQYPGIEDANGIWPVDYSEGLDVGYKWYESQGITPLFPFGYGLSYTNFSYRHLNVAT